MKAWITPEGFLVVDGETKTEDYALRKWVIDWHKRKAVLRVMVTDPNKPSKVAPKIVETGEYVSMVNKEDV